MRTYLLSTAAALALIGGIATTQEAAAAPSTVSFTLGSISTTAYGGNNGLIIHTAPGPEVPQTFTLEEDGPAKTFTIMRIWTPETEINLDDFKARDFGLTMNFSAPMPGFSATVGGETSGNLILGKFLLSAGIGYLEWDKNHFLVDFTSSIGTGTLKISLEDEDFNRGKFKPFGNDLDPGKYSGGFVDATFRLVDFTPVPEPGTLALLGAGLLGLGLMRRRGAAAAA